MALMPGGNGPPNKPWGVVSMAKEKAQAVTRDIEEAEKSIAYLQQQISQTNIADLRTALYSLVEEQTKTLMLANVRDE